MPFHARKGSVLELEERDVQIWRGLLPEARVRRGKGKKTLRKVLCFLVLILYSCSLREPLKLNSQNYQESEDWMKRSFRPSLGRETPIAPGRGFSSDRKAGRRKRGDCAALNARVAKGGPPSFGSK